MPPSSPARRIGGDAKRFTAIALGASECIAEKGAKFPSRLPKLWCLATPVELQADCLAAVWGHRAQGKRDLLDPGDVDQALQMAPEQRKRWAKSRPAIQCRRTRYKAPAVT